MKSVIIITLLYFLTLNAKAEPWVNTDNLSLRADIETLAAIGVIKVPINSYPLMWAGIIQDLDAAAEQSMGLNYRKVFWRVKKAARKALSKNAIKELRFSISNAEPVFRSFGDFERGKGQLTALSAGVKNDFAWRLQANRRYHPTDGETLDYDGSYVSAIWGNWATSIGSIEQWWGASWDSTNLMSNNARSPVAIRLQRNYSDPSDLPLLNWLGYWNFSAFVAALTDDRITERPYLAAANFSIKPSHSIEATFSLSSLIGGQYKLATSRQDIDYANQKRQVGLDLSWQVNQDVGLISLPTKVYASITNDNAGADYNSLIFGFSSHLPWFGGWRIFLEQTDTLSATEIYNQTYEDGIYQTGYRFSQRAIGSSYDADSKVTSLGLMGQISYYQWLSIKLQSLSINQAGNQSPIDQRHTINAQQIDAKRILLNWRYQMGKQQQLNIELDYSDKLISQLTRENERVRLMINWVVGF